MYIQEPIHWMGCKDYYCWWLFSRVEYYRV